MRRIVIEELPRGDWAVSVGEFAAIGVNSGEALECAARYILTGWCPYLRNPIQNVIDELRWRDTERLLPAPKPGSEDWKVTGHVFIIFKRIFWK